jgi:hypothetical protein
MKEENKPDIRREYIDGEWREVRCDDVWEEDFQNLLS